MYRALGTVLLLACSIALFAQDTVGEELQALLEAEQYERIVEHAPRAADYSAKALYCIGQAYFMLEQDDKCLQFMDRSIAKDDTDPAAHFTRASALSYSGDHQGALKGFQAALKLGPDHAKSLIGLGDAYAQLEQYDQAIEAYMKATQQPDCPDRAYLMIADVYAEQEEHQKALEAYRTVQQKVPPGSDAYVNVLYNIGLLESLHGDADKAEAAFKEVLQLNPADHHTCAKLIQLHYRRQQYAAAQPYKDILYSAHKQGALNKHLQDMFCIDQFPWKNYQIQVYERYQSEGNGDIYDKHRFYVVDYKGDIVMRAQTEFSPISVELGGPKYLLCANKGGTHYNPGIGFNDDFLYDDLKAAALKLIEKTMAK